MAKESLGTVVRRRVLGIGYLALVAALILLSILIYQKKFTPVALVTVKTDHTGNSLQKSSDVKERGIIVGEVRNVQVDSGPNGGCANEQSLCVTVTLALMPSQLSIIPKNVSAAILPKTIFGEQYVALELPQHKAAPIANGDQIPQDRSAGALEATKVVGDLLPLLQAVKPAELNATLNALATALQGRGAELGRTLVHMDQYLRATNPHTKALVDDLSRLGRVATEYNGVAPALFNTLRNFQTTAQTIIAEKSSLSSLLTTATDTANVARSFLAANEQHLITLTGTTDKVYGLLQQYSPEYPCLFAGLNKLQKLASGVVVNNQYQLSIVADNTSQGKYTQGQEPRYVTGYGPQCFGLPDNVTPVVDGHFQIPGKYRCLNDGAPLTADPCAQRGGSQATQTADDTALGSPSENALVSSLLAGRYHTTPQKVPPIATMLAAPLMRGAKVAVK